MNPANSQIAPDHAPTDNPLSVMQPGEQVVCEIRRHPIGMLGIYIAAGFLVVLVAVMALIVAPHAASAHQNQVTGWGAIIFLVIAVLTTGFVFVSNKVYWGNRWVVTTDSITQVSQNSFFDRQTSQLSLGNLEDVTAEQDGILSHMFGYGMIRAETAGERSKFTFLFCPNPNYYAQQILNAREQFEQRRSGENQQRPYRAEGAYAAPEAVPPQPS